MEASMAYSSAEETDAAFVFFRGRRQFRNAVVQIVDVAPVAMAAPAHHIRTQPLAQIRPHVHEPDAVGREHPFIGVHRQHIRLNPARVEAQRSQALRAVDDTAARRAGAETPRSPPAAARSRCCNSPS